MGGIFMAQVGFRKGQPAHFAQVFGKFHEGLGVFVEVGAAQGAPFALVAPGFQLLEVGLDVMGVYLIDVVDVIVLKVMQQFPHMEG
ncbi:MAG: hypothetical protein AAGA18_15950, partial [Verrucomicrobiota bacterium]